MAHRTSPHPGNKISEHLPYIWSSEMANFRYDAPMTYTRLSSHHRSGDQWFSSASGRTPGTTYREEKSEAPWQQTARAYTWVVEQEIIKHDKRDRKAEQWILEQQIVLTARKGEGGLGRWSYSRQSTWEDQMYTNRAEQRMRGEEEARRIGAERQRRARMIEEEGKRIEAKIRSRREEKQRRLVEEKRRLQETNERQIKADRAMLTAWRSYEERWRCLEATPEPLDFSSIPWPVLRQPTGAEEIDSRAITSFLLSSVHSRGQSKKVSVRKAQLRWHPDRFRRILAKVRTEDKASVEAAAGIVARCLNSIEC